MQLPKTSAPGHGAGPRINRTETPTETASPEYGHAARWHAQSRDFRILTFDYLQNSGHFLAPGKLPPAQVIADVIEALGNDVLEIRPGPAEQLYQIFLQSPEQAQEAINAMTNADGNVRTDS